MITDNKKYIFLTQYVVDKCGGVETIQNWYSGCGLNVEVVIIPDKVEIKGNNN